MKKKIIAVIFLITAFSCFAQKSVKPKDIDIDLSLLGFNMTYAQLFNMMAAPEKYEGKKICMKGIFMVFDYEMDGKPKKDFACVVSDTAGCCMQGLSFELKNKAEYPNGYPALNSTITVVGRFHCYEVNGVYYTCLVDAELL